MIIDLPDLKLIIKQMKKLLVVFGISVITFACGSSDEKKADAPVQEDTVAATPTIQNERGLELIGAS